MSAQPPQPQCALCSSVVTSSDIAPSIAKHAPLPTINLLTRVSKAARTIYTHEIKVFISRQPVINRILMSYFPLRRLFANIQNPFEAKPRGTFQMENVTHALTYIDRPPIQLQIKCLPQAEILTHQAGIMVVVDQGPREVWICARRFDALLQYIQIVTDRTPLPVNVENTPIEGNQLPVIFTYNQKQWLGDTVRLAEGLVPRDHNMIYSFSFTEDDHGDQALIRFVRMLLHIVFPAINPDILGVSEPPV